MADQVGEIKSKVDIVSIIGERITLQKAGRNFKALCPFHSEKTPSFMISPELQIYKCFGCMEAGDVITFLEKYEGMDFPEALKYLADRTGVKLKAFAGSGATEKEKLYEINALASKFYHYLLMNHKIGKPALDYLTHERGINLDSIKTFVLGFAPSNYSTLFDFLTKKRSFKKEDLEEAGLTSFSGKGTVDRFRNRIIFPLLDHRGNTVGLAGRILSGEDKNVAKYINSPETSVYHKGSLLYAINVTKQEIKKEGFIVIVEGELDAISSWQAGVKNITAIKGTAFTEDQARLVSRFTQNLVLALDSDLAGDAASRRSIVIADRLGLTVRVAKLGKYKDPDEAARADINEYKKSIVDAVNIWDFLIESVTSKLDLGSGQGVSDASKELIPILRMISDKIVQERYLKIVAARLNVSEEAVSEQLKNSIDKNQAPKIDVSPSISETKTRRDLLEELLLSLAFQSDLNILLKQKTQDLIKTPLAKRILTEFLKFREKTKEFEISTFAQNLPKELFDGFSKTIFVEIPEKIKDTQAFDKEVILVEKELKALDLKEKLSYSAKLISKFEEEGKSGELEKAKTRFRELSIKFSSKV
ncbi:DNA primase [Candidatus Woesebacteria bacterium RIFCSPHIGHO2_02_FULL_38_9]|uniref:DNA primase n=1 Tax=Candidatus Woesebacteria bacterium RIFCSPHIGHO2_01_FULL_39_28 TaxID=1802496 RepID=A0A1F7YJ06_9BACT|nr:MAG: DNA primase [Candidatus Woesebacteria bacterium RIFCSPHIGHO2_01_FULL_39_28]OGM31476.1 MAG: DNA primase [Candidatus Woesebacteria bacterium RIFCSPHIGHO2_02_FULL_38_9]OGM56662.1 MAG: DNA primase [Candidatus Woesebacteria bacterium RIFCSPLOWO2_01_FULL_38_20]